MNKNQPVGLIGLGFMGGALAGRLRAARFEVLGYDIDAAKTARLATIGVKAAASVADIGRHCSRVLLAVYDTTQVEDVIEGEAGLNTVAHSQTVLCISTVEPERIAALAERAARSGINLIECPISGTSSQVRDGAGVGLLAGAPAVIDNVSDILDAICPKRFVVGEIGDAAKAKLGINLVLQLNRAALAEGLVFAERLGLASAAFLEILRGSAAHSQVMDTKGEKMLHGDFSPQSRIAQTLKDAELMLNAASEAGQRLPLMEVNAALLAESIKQGGGERDSSAVIDAIRRRRIS
jgi:3-hydroxyisobutyrate dehydrogenase-like beta-hydroxyacid dehydrogenase